jgi:hypothetical protein
MTVMVPVLSALWVVKRVCHFWARAMAVQAMSKVGITVRMEILLFLSLGPRTLAFAAPKEVFGGEG